MKPNYKELASALGVDMSAEAEEFAEKVFNLVTSNLLLEEAENKVRAIREELDRAEEQVQKTKIEIQEYEDWFQQNGREEVLGRR